MNLNIKKQRDPPPKNKHAFEAVNQISENKFSLTWYKKIRIFSLLKCTFFLGNDLFAEGISRRGHCQKVARGEVHFSET